MKTILCLQPPAPSWLKLKHRFDRTNDFFCQSIYVIINHPVFGLLVHMNSCLARKVEKLLYVCMYHHSP